MYTNTKISNKKVIVPDDIIVESDSYKVGQHKMYQPGTQAIFAFQESRGGPFPAINYFGLQYIVKRYLLGKVLTKKNIATAAKDFEQHFVGTPASYNRRGWEHILDKHNGHLPVRICAVPEGMTIPNHNALSTIESTDHEVPWVGQYLEGLIAQTWFPCTVSTQSMFLRHSALRYLELSGTPALIDYMMNNFSYRGCSSTETAAIGDMAYSVHFKGSDVMKGFRYSQAYYHCRMSTNSINASEHSTISSWGRDREGDGYEHALNEFPDGMLAQVSDTWDIFNACANLWGGRFRDRILNRNGVLVIRPDSGDPVPVILKVIAILGDKFGYIVNGKGYKVLPPQVRLIQGDGIDRFSFELMLKALTDAGWSADNIVFGSGGGLIQKLDRDTMKFKIAASATLVNGVWYDFKKDPITDPGKTSKEGRLALVRDENGEYATITQEAARQRNLVNLHQRVFENGWLYRDQTMDEIRANALLP